MALIKCPKCGKEFSDRAEKCPLCGTSREELERLIAENEAQVVAERERLRKEREAKTAEEERLRKEKRAAWWKKNTKWFITSFAILILVFFAYVGYVNRSTIEVSNKNEISIFRFRKSTKLIIPEGVTKIEDDAFSNCPGIISVIIPNSVTSIGNRAFKDCSCLTSIIVPNNVINIGEQAFSGCMELTSVTIGNNVTEIENYAFEDCSSLTSVIWNATSYTSPSYPGNAPFSDISSQISSFTFGKDVESIPANLCFGMINLTSITIPNSVISIGDWAFYGCSNLKSIVIPNSVKSIEDYAFSGCVNLNNIEIPSSVISIGKRTFARDYIVAAENPKFCSSEGILFNKNKTILISCSVEKQGNISIPNSVIKIGEKAFAGCVGLKTVSIPNSVTSIGKEAFSGCSNLTSIVIPNSVRHIGDLAFCDCTSLATITIPNSVTNLDELALAFGDCKKLSVKVPQRFKGNYVSCKNVTYY